MLLAVDGNAALHANTHPAKGSTSLAEHGFSKAHCSRHGYRGGNDGSSRDVHSLLIDADDHMRAICQHWLRAHFKNRPGKRRL
jgi:hypothetical protein